MIRKSGWLKYMRDQKLTAFIPSASLLSSLPLCLPLHLFHLLLCSEQVLKCWTWKKNKMKKFKKKKKTKTFLTFCSTSLPLYSPLSGSSSKSNLAHVSILTPFPSFYLSASPLICLFLFILHPFLFPLWFSSSLTSAPFPHYTSCFRLSSISLLTSLPSVPPSISCNMKGYLCADSQGRRRAES